MSKKWRKRSTVYLKINERLQPPLQERIPRQLPALRRASARTRSAFGSKIVLAIFLGF